jgi:HK97 gp10 family phage protein
MLDRIRSTGLNRLKSKLNKLKDNVKGDAVDQALFQAAAVVAGEAQRRVTGGGNSTSTLNVREGILRSGIKAVKIRKHVAAVSTSGVIYARIHEFGGQAARNHSATIPPRPYLRPALKVKKKEALEIIRKVYTGPLKFNTTSETD